MRKTSYVVAFFAVLLTLVFNVLSIRRSDWLVTTAQILTAKITTRYGLTQTCQLTVTSMPGWHDGTEIVHYDCRPFPAREQDACEKKNRYFCIAWTTAGFVSELGVGFAVVSCLAIVFGVTTHSRRRRIWRAVAVLVALHAVCLIATFAIITDAYTNDSLSEFHHARPGAAYVLGTLAWIFAVFTTFGVFVTGTAASRGHKWAAGNRAYQPIQG